MKQSATVKTLFALALSLVFITACEAQNRQSPNYGNRFWKLWGDGNAELAGYDLTYLRYGKLRQGTAVAIFVTEDFSDTLRVKADPGKHPKSDVYPVLKLNLMQDFPTGLYDYSLMTSTFVKANGDADAGLPVKVSFSAQEWCGHVFAHLLFGNKEIDLTSHSYFDGEADQQQKLNLPTGGISEDALFHWARGLASPVLKPGESMKIKLLRSLAHSRLNHQPLQWVDATLHFDPKPTTVPVAAGTFEVDRLTCTLANGMSWTFYIDRKDPYRMIVQWETSEGEKGSLIKSKRLPYWKLNDNGDESILSQIGLTARGKRMP